MPVIALSRGMTASVDDCDLASLSQHRWHAIVNTSGLIYAGRKVTVGRKRKLILMHRAILCAPDGVEVDHRNGDGLNNSRRNLRLASHQQNMWNRREPGDSIAWDEASGRWSVTVAHAGAKIRLGFYLRREDAEAARDFVLSRLRGDFAARPCPSEFDLLVLPPKIRRMLFSPVPLPSSQWRTA